MILETKATTKHAKRTLTAPWDRRRLSRWRGTTDDGEEVTVLLPRGVSVRGGEVLASRGGETVAVLAAEEELSEAEADGALLVARGAYHLGNRHVPLQFEGGRLRYQRDHVLDEMLRVLGFRVRGVRGGFDPEPGPYHGGHGHGGRDEP